MSEDPRMVDVRRRLLRPASVEDVRGTLRVLDDMSASPESAKSAEEGLRRAFECLRELTAAEPYLAVEILTGDLLPRCLMPDGRDDRGYGYRHCHAFGEWLDDLPEEYRHRVRVAALPRAIAALGGDGVRNAIRLISSIGYWDDDVLDALDRLARGHDDERGDHALSARVALRSALEPSVRRLYLGRLHSRIPAGPNLHQISCGRVIGTPETAELVWSHWLAPLTTYGSERSLLTYFARSLLVEIAAREHDPGFTTQVWSWLVELSRRPAKGVEDVFAPNSSLVNSLDLPAVVPELVRLASRSEANQRYLYYLRVLECARPAHMAGWDEVTPAELAVVRQDAIAPTGMTGRSSTIELHQKEAAWDVLLCCGEASALPPFDDALAEEGGYVAHHFLELAACLRLVALPRIVGTLLAASTEGAAWGEDERLAAQIGAIEAARGAGTGEAFDALRGYRKIGEGVLLSLVEALAETALIVSEGGDRSAIERLLMTAEISPREDSRGAAAAAVAALLEEGALTAPETTRAAALLPRPTTDPYARRGLLFAFATLPAADVPPAAVDYASGVLTSQAEEQNGDPRPAALALVARRLGARSDPEFLSRHLGLTEHGGVPVASPLTLRGVAPHVVGRYFAVEPERFGPVVASLLRDGDGSAIAHVLPSVREAAARNPNVVLDALVARLREADSGRVAAPALLHTLAAVAPDRLLADGCPNMAAWLPNARADLADTLGGLGPLPEGQANARFELLNRLAGDGIYAVRRAAYRAAAACDVDRFIGLALSWARWREQGRQGPRRYAAECAGWLPASVEHSQLGWDQEPAVREAYERSLREREDRLAAGEFEERVLGVRDPADITRNWRHGIGLSRVGDDSTIRRLSDRLGDGLPPSVRFWLKRVRKAVEQRWGEVTRKWPEPWFARPGHLESFSGVLKGDDGKETVLAGTLWLLPAESPGGKSSWGGWATSKNRGMRDGELMIPGRRPAQILVAQISVTSSLPTSELLFWGNGPYPDPARAM